MSGLHGVRLALIAALALSSQAEAATLTESDFYGEMPVVLSASRLSQPLAQAPAAVTVIDQRMIRASGFRDIPDLFRLVPGFNVAYTRFNTWGVGYHGLADAYSRRMQVLIDGRSVYLPGFGQTLWSALPLSIEDIDRIEVVRGPNAAAYGANAFFGVINIVTKDPYEVQVPRLSVQAGQQDMHGVLLRYGGESGDFRYRMTLSEQQRDRFKAQAEKTTTRHIDFRGDYRVSNSDELTVNFAASKGDWRQGKAGDIEDPIRDDIDVGGEQFQLKYKRVIDPRTEWSLQFYHIRSKVDDAFIASGVDVAPGPAVVRVDIPFNYDQTNWREDLEFQMVAGLSQSTRVVWGAEARWEAAEAPGYFYAKDKRSGALYRLFGNVEWTPSQHWVINGGLMAEDHYYTGLDLSPRLAVNYVLSPDHAFRASVGQAFRSPTFFEVEGDVRYFTTTNVLLRQFYAPVGTLHPERIFSRELGYIGRAQALNLQIDGRLFYDKVTKLIGQQDVGVSSKTFRSFNESYADIRGADVQLRWQPHRDFDVILNYARVNIDSNDKDMAQSAPKNNISALAAYRFGDGWEASAMVNRIDTMKWLDDGDTVEAFTRVDARLGRQWNWRGHDFELAVVGQNLSGDAYAEFRDNHLFDRRAYFSLGFEW